MNRDNDRQTSIILAVLGILPIVWLGLLIAPSVKGGLPEILPSLMNVMSDPFHIELCEDSVKTVLVLLLCYGMGIGIYFSTRRNYRRREEHGSAKWGNAKAVDKKYRQNPPSENKLMTQAVRIGLNGKKHRRNLNTLVCGGSGAGKTRFYCKPNLMQANTSFVILDPKGEIVRDVGNLLEKKGYEIRVLDLISMEKSHCYNPFVYLHSDNDVQRLVTNLFKSTTPKGSQSNDPFWDNQLDWYKPILAARPDWTLTAQYIDEGITGTSAEKRPQFMKMVEDARQKKFNMIITREVSRFARNTVDTLQYTRLLKEYGVEVFFLNDNIKTFDGDGELRLTIMATLAQDESRKTSIRVKAGQETSMQNGVFYGNGNILGYDRVGKEMVINPEQAKTVRMIYDMYLSGMGVTTIQYELEKAGRLTALGKERWFASYISKMLRNSFYCGIITYHKEYTPDFLKQKKIKNYGDLEYVQVQGTHEPIVTVEEYEQVQKLMDAKSAVLKNHNKGKRRTGRMQHTTVYGRLMICQCGNKFNLRFHSRDGRTDGVDYQCYTSVNRGSVAKRLNKGISIEHSCESPYIQGWKLEMMAEQVFDRYIENADKVMDLSYAMLEKHIADQEELPDNTDVIRRKQGEIEKLMNKRTNLIEMRAEGDIDKEMFRSKKQEIEDRVAKLTEEIKGLQPEKEQTSNEDYSVKLLELRERLKEYTGFDYSVIPESIVEAFIERIWVSKDEFRWYLRTGNNADGEFDPDDHIKIGAFTLTIDDAKKYIYSFSTRRRVYKWADLNVSVWI